MNEKILLGVCLWLANRFRLNAIGLRIIFIALVLVGFKIRLVALAALVIYLAIYLLIPWNEKK